MLVVVLHPDTARRYGVSRRQDLVGLWASFAGGSDAQLQELGLWERPEVKLDGAPD